MAQTLMEAPDSTASRPAETAISTRNLGKTFGRPGRERYAVKGLNLEVPAGRIIGFVGPNGSGKTTTIRMLLGLIRPTSGTGEVLGGSISNPASYLDRVGALVEMPAFYPTLSGKVNLDVLCSMGGLSGSTIPEVLELVDLTERARDNVGTYSLGMKQRLGVAAALLSGPDLLILDEPANGLDPEGIIEMRELLRRLRDEGKTVFISSHLLGELEQVADWLVMIRSGEAVYTGPMRELTTRQTGTIRIGTDRASDAVPLAHIVERLGLVPRIVDGQVEVDASREIAGQVNSAAMKEGMILTEIHHERGTLEESFLSMLSGENHA